MGWNGIVRMGKWFESEQDFVRWAEGKLARRAAPPPPVSPLPEWAPLDEIQRHYRKQLAARKPAEVAATGARRKPSGRTGGNLAERRVLQGQIDELERRGVRAWTQFDAAADDLRKLYVKLHSLGGPPPGRRSVAPGARERASTR